MSVESAVLAGFQPALSIGAFAAVLGAGFVRGYGGFGFALAAVPLLTAFWEPRHALPTVLLLEMALSLVYLPGNWRLVDWRGVGLLLLGAVCATPIGLYLLSSAPPYLVRIGAGALLCISVLLLWHPIRTVGRPRSGHTVAAGAVSGLMGGSTAMSGPPIILHYLNAGADPRNCRASMIAYFLASSAIALLYGMAGGLYVENYFADGLVLAPAAIAGSVVGSRCFAVLPTPSYRRVTLIGLGVLGVFTIVRELL